LAVDSQGFVYVLGFTSTADFPTWRAFQPSSVGYDLLVIKLDPSGSLVYSTYLGGDSSESAGAIEADAQGNAYVTGSTNSANFPLVRKLTMPSPTIWRSQAFVTKLSPDGSTLVYSTLLGGKGGSDFAQDLAVDAAGNVYLAGGTDSPDFPVRNPLQPVLRGSADGFLAKLSPQPALLYATYFGGSQGDMWGSISLGADGRLHATGTTNSTDYPLVVRADRTTYGDGRVYHLFFEARDPAGRSCTGVVKVCVPLQSGGTCRDGGARMDSTLAR
jgi:hypothetical protein